MIDFEVRKGGVQHTAVLDRVTDTHVHDDLLQARDLHDVWETELLPELRNQLLPEPLLHPGV